MSQQHPCPLTSKHHDRQHHLGVACPSLVKVTHGVLPYFAVVLSLATGCGQAGTSVSQAGTPADTDDNGKIQAAEKDGDKLAKLAVGDKAPDFQVELLGGKSFRLSEHIANTTGPTVLLFNRAHW